MTTDQLISTLTANMKSTPRRAVLGRVCLGVLCGVAGSIAVLLMTLGVRPDLQAAVHGFHFWMKWAYAAALGAGAVYAVDRLARPVSGTLYGLWFLVAPALLLAGVAMGELENTPSEKWLALWLGNNWIACPWRVLVLACPIFLGLLWSFRKLAPTRLRAAGAAAGLAAGAWAATIYCLYCPEASAIFVLTWYSLGILLATAGGALLGPRVLRW